MNTVKLFRVFLAAMLALAVTACSSSANTTANVDPTADFTRYKTYNFLPTPGTDGQEFQSLETGYLKRSTSRELNARGFSQSDQPDMIVNFSIETQEKIRSRPTGGGGFYGAYDPFYDVYYDGWGATHTTRIDQYTEGKLNIDIIDPTARKLVWQGTISGRITQKDLENAEAVLDESVVEIFKQFPVQAPAPAE